MDFFGELLSGHGARCLFNNDNPCIPNNNYSQSSSQVQINLSILALLDACDQTRENTQSSYHQLIFQCKQPWSPRWLYWQLTVRQCRWSCIYICWPKLVLKDNISIYVKNLDHSPTQRQRTTLHRKLVHVVYGARWCLQPTFLFNMYLYLMRLFSFQKFTSN